MLENLDQALKHMKKYVAKSAQKQAKKAKKGSPL
tara:strand:- start:63672 stop:63773 length:102 start_codon:yes stop_codon:yes gene_type:complete